MNLQAAELIRTNGTFNRAAIKAAVAALVEAQREWLSRWSGEPLAFWTHRIWQNAVDNVLREAARQRAAFIVARLSVRYSRDERARLDDLADAAGACPISAAGNALAADLRCQSSIIRERAERAAYARVEAQILRDAGGRANRRAA